MRTSTEWWNQTKANPQLLTEWLQKQYYGEITAADRIHEYCESRSPTKWRKTLNLISQQEHQHASWILELLHNRGLQPVTPDAPNRYWNQTLPQVNSFESATAVAAHAELMRLERIRAIVADESAPVDAREAFRKILVDEEFHARAFTRMAGEEALSATSVAHQNGLKELGLIMVDEVL